MCRINPRVDFAFKKLFGSEENNDLLQALVNAILEPEIKIAELTVKNPYNLADYKAGKLSILEIKAKDDGGRWYNIEMQVNEDAHYDKRAIFYWAKLVTEQLTEGRMYAELRNTISINILDFLYTPGERFHSRYGILNRETCEDDRLHGVFDLHYLELRKFHKGFDELTTALDRWATFLSRAHELDKRAMPRGMTGDPNIQKAVEAVDRMFDEEERLIYEVRMQSFADEAGRLAAAVERARSVALVEGKAEGIAVGKTEGKAEGKMEVARQLRTMGMSLEQISVATGLEENELTGLVGLK